MAGSSCEHCIFSQWKGQIQDGCALRRLDKLENIIVINDDFTGSYRVTTSNICTAKRTKSWLKDHPRNPVEQVRQELFPKLQLIILIDKISEAWVDFFAKADFSKYSVVDILVFEPEMTFIKSIGNFIAFKNVFIHACMPVENTLCSVKEHHINHFVRKDCQFYVLTDDPTNDLINDWPDKLDNYLNEQCKTIYMAYEIDGYENEKDFNNKLIYTPMHFTLGGYGSQPIDDKISIYTLNHQQYELVQEIDEIWKEKVDESTTFAT